MVDNMLKLYLIVQKYIPEIEKIVKEYMNESS